MQRLVVDAEVLCSHCSVQSAGASSVLSSGMRPLAVLAPAPVCTDGPCERAIQHQHTWFLQKHLEDTMSCKGCGRSAPQRCKMPSVPWMSRGAQILNRGFPCTRPWHLTFSPVPSAPHRIQLQNSSQSLLLGACLALRYCA